MRRRGRRRYRTDSNAYIRNPRAKRHRSPPELFETASHVPSGHPETMKSRRLGGAKRNPSATFRHRQFFMSHWDFFASSRERLSFRDRHITCMFDWEIVCSQELRDRSRSFFALNSTSKYGPHIKQIVALFPIRDS